METNQTAMRKPSIPSVYWKLTKPRLWVMLTYTAGIGFLASLKVQSAPVLDGVLAIVAVAFATSGANAITSFFDRDIDSIMNRTKHRPIPSGRIKPPEHALHFGLILISISLIILFAALKFVAAIIGIIGLVDNIIVYSIWLKRRSPLNVILGGFSGGAPILVGWSVNANILSPIPFLMAAMVVLWIPSHIWSLALKWRDDYSRAGIPMLTAVIDLKNAIRCVASTSILIVIFSVILIIIGPFGVVYALIATITGSILLALTFWLIIRPSSRAAFILFKYTSPYLALLLAAMIFNFALENFNI